MVFGYIINFFGNIVQSSRSALAIYVFSFLFWVPLFWFTYDNMAIPLAYTISGLASILPGAAVAGFIFLRKTWDGGIKAIILTSIFFAILMIFAAGFDYRWINVMYFLDYVELLGIEILLFTLSIVGLFIGLIIRKLFNK
ncbi:MAG: hypothetical protein P8Y18_09850 [Candidatus Bathyarchaeota archaeon]